MLRFKEWKIYADTHIYYMLNFLGHYLCLNINHCLYFDIAYKRFALHNTYVTPEVTMEDEDGIKYQLCVGVCVCVCVCAHCCK
jgi:hypothetical protein